jgi:Bacterial aa3 type cytochrome c oxidase subunit IV
MVDEAHSGHDIRMQREMWSVFCKIVKFAVIGLAVMLLLMWAFLV